MKPSVWLPALLLAISLVVSDRAAASDPKILHVLNRLSFGIRPGDVEKVEAMGVDRYIQTQLAPDAIAVPDSLAQQLAQLETLRLTPTQLREYGRSQPGQKPTEAQIKASRQKSRLIVQQAMQAKLLRAAESPRQLQELLVDFWFNHFNVSTQKNTARIWVGAYEETAIRSRVLGRFRDLLEATARHPAMLFYLDNWQNTAPGSPGARGRFQGLNENYARELLELHTLGVDGGYTQQDVTTLAKILTGWGVQRGQKASASGFYFDAERHDFSDKTFLGQRIRGRGEAEVEQALDILASSPATARHISSKLAQFFVADQPPKPLVDRLAQRYLATDGNLRAVLETLFQSPEFWQSAGGKFKTPYQYVVSALRSTNTRPDPSVLNLLQQMGMPLYGAPTPEGYKNTEAAWLNPDALARRLSFATLLAQKQRVDADQLATTIANPFSAQTRDAIASSRPPLRAALMLGSPEFMRR
jgi:uncharacterized protein (DUF1800 family)